MMSLSLLKNNWTICIHGPNRIRGIELYKRFKHHGFKVIYITWCQGINIDKSPDIIEIEPIPPIYKDPLSWVEHNANRMKKLALEGLKLVKTDFSLRTRDDIEFGDILLLIKNLVVLEKFLDNRIGVLNIGTSPFEYFAYHLSDYLTIGKTDKQIEIWNTMDTSSNDLSLKHLIFSKLIHGKTGFRGTRYAAEQQLGLSVAKHFGIQPSLEFIDDNKDIKFKDKFLEHILICSEEYLQIKGPQRLFDDSRIKFTQQKFQFSKANDLTPNKEYKAKRIKSLLALPTILVMKCINILFSKY